ncbi:MAG: methylated-DNA--[protein]-cysteine S-methyltransferase [Anaerolineae bacterium]
MERFVGHQLTAFETGWGWVGIAMSVRGLAGLIFPEPTRDSALEKLRTRWLDGEEVEAGTFENLIDQIRRYLAGEPVEFDVALDWLGHAAFLQDVWKVTRSIPYGETRTYAELAEEAGRPRAYRAVGQAMAVNPIPLIVPCHRVVRSDGGLGGYAGGLEVKRRLLDMERTGQGTQAAPGRHGRAQGSGRS